MEIREVQDKRVWEGFLRGCSDKTFLQSWNWGEFQALLRGKVWRLGVFEDGELKAVALVVKVEARRGTFLLVPHGPVSPVPDPALLAPLVQELRELAANEGASFVRVNPVWERTERNTAAFTGCGFRPAPIQMHPESSWKLEIAKSAEELLSDMRKTTRQLVRKTSLNPGIVVRKSRDPKDVELFSSLHERVSKRQGFVPFSRQYLMGEFSAFDKDGEVLLFVGEVEGRTAAASFVVFWSGVGFYHHAASLPKFSRFSVPYRLQWEAVLEAQKRGCTLYDFWGFVDPKEQPDHPWAGPTLFKTGFGGRAHLYVKTQDLPLSSRYWATWAFERARRIKRGL